MAQLTIAFYFKRKKKKKKRREEKREEEDMVAKTTTTTVTMTKISLCQEKLKKKKCRKMKTAITLKQL